MNEFITWFWSVQGAITTFVSFILILTIISVFEIRKAHKLERK